MNKIIQPSNPVIFMKVGVHARESLEDIIQRKLKEIQREGMSMWGYGGSTCHPNRVQPFAEEEAASGKPIFLCMEKMISNHYAEPLRADEYSVDGVKWKKIPKGINVLGSRYALVIDTLQEKEFSLPVARTVVAAGPSIGRRGSEYISGRVDKACLRMGPSSDIPPPPDEKVINIGLVAKLKDPYAVFLRNT
ncbi:hypothetical protein KK141_17300 [Dyella sp. LX-66]|uniref:hypothetical protein n=1 Tax=unclassified Dyella TaxID=2634549 RepID=UPI001BE0A255|nr:MULTISPECIES: hypothetical protein [unclassified Dyella]MBT2117791.1 hypothetical protein [Dyella sp. LX-1]MBT2141306.1 hypothetical protein [Dyella sp. LX-66]